MILDTSVLVAIVLEEPGFDELLRLVLAADRVGMSAGSWLETCIVIDRKQTDVAATKLQMVAVEAHISIIDLTPAHAERARAAYRRFGKGNHPAKLNFGDCIAFATAELARERLLYKGEDFAHAEVRADLETFAHRV